MGEHGASEKAVGTRRFVHWCGICFAWRAAKDGRCVQCGNAHMRGSVEVTESSSPDREGVKP